MYEYPRLKANKKMGINIYYNLFKNNINSL